MIGWIGLVGKQYNTYIHMPPKPTCRVVKRAGQTGARIDPKGCTVRTEKSVMRCRHGGWSGPTVAPQAHDLLLPAKRPGFSSRSPRKGKFVRFHPRLAVSSRGTAGYGGRTPWPVAAALWHFVTFVTKCHKAHVYLDYTYYINILEDAYGC